MFLLYCCRQNHDCLWRDNNDGGGVGTFEGLSEEPLGRGTTMTEEESGPLRDCLKNHWDEVGQEMYEMFSSHVKMTTTRNSHTCCPGSGTDVEVVLNSRPDIPDQLHCLLYFLVDGLMGGFINPTDIKTEENVECRKIMTPGHVDHKGRRRDVSQLCVVTNQIDKDEVIWYVYVYSKVRGVGRWFEGEDEVCVRDYKLPRRCRTLGDYLESIRL
jgi:hypothetical protein